MNNGNYLIYAVLRLRLVCVWFALGGYAASMTDNSVINCLFIVRSQAEYSPATQTMSVRCILEMPTTGQHHGFTDVEALLSSLRVELMAMHNQIIPEQKEEPP